MNQPPFQIAVDCRDPHAQVRFWAAALDYEVEQHPGMIQDLLDQGLITDDDLVVIDGVPSFKTGAAMNDPGGVRPRWYFQLVPEPKAVKNRMHVDIRHDGSPRAAAVTRLEELGATALYEGRQGPNTWITMADPEGNEFCVSGDTD